MQQENYMNLSNKMKVKKDKKAEKRVKDAETQEEPQPSVKSHKKAKLSKVNGNDNDEGTAETQTTPVPVAEKSIKSVDSNIFKFFKDLTSDEEQTRMEAALHLVQQLGRNKDEEKVSRRCFYDFIMTYCLYLYTETKGVGLHTQTFDTWLWCFYQHLTLGFLYGSGGFLEGI